MYTKNREKTKPASQPSSRHGSGGILLLSTTSEGPGTTAHPASPERAVRVPAPHPMLCPCTTHPYGVAAGVVRQSAGTTPPTSNRPLTTGAERGCKPVWSPCAVRGAGQGRAPQCSATACGAHTDGTLGVQPVHRQVDDQADDNGGHRALYRLPGACYSPGPLRGSPPGPREPFRGSGSACSSRCSRCCLLGGRSAPCSGRCPWWCPLCTVRIGCACQLG